MFPIFVSFHVPVLIHIFILFYFQSPNPKPRPWHMPDSRYPDMFSLVLIRSDPHVCSSVWNRHWLSLELIVWTSEPLSVSHPKFEDSRRLVAQHISWSRVSAEHIEPWYTFGPSPAHNSLARGWKVTWGIAVLMKNAHRSLQFLAKKNFLYMLRTDLIMF